MIDGLPLQQGAVILTSSCGNGHKIVADYLYDKQKTMLAHLYGRKVEHLSPKEIDAVIRKEDVVKGYLGQNIGNQIEQVWNKAQQAGDVNKLEKLSKQQTLANVLFFVPIFIGTMKSLVAARPKVLLNTQVMGIEAVLFAVKVYNTVMGAIHGKKWTEVKVEIWMSDLPELGAHFLKPLRKVISPLKNNLVLRSIAPTVETGKQLEGNEAIKWLSSQAGLKPHQVKLITDDCIPVGKVYYSEDLKNYSPGTAVDLPLRLTQHQRDLLQVLNCNDRIEVSGDNFKYQIKESDKVHSIMLGSQPTEELCLKAASTFIKEAQKIKQPTGWFSKPLPEHHVFIFCGKDVGYEESTFKKVWAKLIQEKNIPSHLKIIPVPFQDPNEIPKILTRSDHRFTRTGGATVYQFLREKALLGEKRTGKIHMFSELKKTDSRLVNATPLEKIALALKQMVSWERGNALHLMRRLNADVVWVGNFRQTVSELFASA